jgi:hypothetical protein
MFGFGYSLYFPSVFGVYSVWLLHYAPRRLRGKIYLRKCKVECKVDFLGIVDER